jgi:K+-sensing histidine kinase KdpD
MALTELIDNGVFGAINEKGELLLTKARLRIGELIVLITNLLDLEKMESGKILVTKQPVKIENVFEDVKVDTAKLAQDKGVNLVIHPCTIEVDADSRRISQSLIAVIQSVIHRVPMLSEVQVEGQQTEDAVVITMSAPHGIAVKGFNNKNKEFAREKMAVSLARLTAQQHGGEFKVDTFNRGRTMTMSLPLKT